MGGPIIVGAARRAGVSRSTVSVGPDGPRVAVATGLVALGLQAGVAEAGGRLRIAGFGCRTAGTVLAWLEPCITPPAEGRLPARLDTRGTSEAA